MKTPELTTRHLAIEIFSAVLRHNKGLEETYSSRMDQHPLESRDRTFIRLLVTVMLRRLGQIDAIISCFLKKPLAEKANYVQDVLRISAAQLVFLDTPAHAAVSTGVSLVKNNKNYSGFAALTNAVLRKIAKEGKEIASKQDEVKLNIPDWLYTEWENEYGKQAAYKIAQAGFQEAPLDFSVKSDPDFWAQQLEAVQMPTGSLRRQKQACVPSLAGFSQGAWWVQDLSAAVPAGLFHDLKNKKAVDLCAAPGGKTAQMIMAGADVTAIDVSLNRIKRLRENLDRLNLTADIVCADVEKWWNETGKRQGLRFDAVLLDAPCSATGTLRRHPDVAFHRTPQDIKRLHQTQYALLKTAIEMMSDEAELIYCVCSVLPQEGRKIIDAVVNDHLAERVKITPSEAPTEMITQDGDLCILPYFYQDQGGCDGFFAARLKKKGSK